ncbi:HK97 family phage prohead protease [Altererythrobacter sp. ZODW24]|uniref:HK97 family phage prohead protease n=1 Tax=Altererythrobacter sp. ZODW24 TaxID=2185142 RepID=UPI000DF81B11|nr:HK97 family phage prohead protease [Altererythrobacter sp. ZODW24]
MRFAGYAALSNRIDGARDTIQPGAFRRSLQGRRDPLPLFWQHKPDKQIGWVEQVLEDAIGLRVIATIDNPQGLAGQMLSSREVDGLSFGYRARRFHHAPSGRMLEDIEIHEVSLVSHPLQHEARVHLIA